GKCVAGGVERRRLQIASWTARAVSALEWGRNRVAESVAKRLSSVKHFGRYDRDLRRAARSPHDSTPHDRVNAGKRLLRGGGDRLPVLGARPATEVVERHRAGPAGLSHDDPADYSRRLVGL